VSKTEALKWLQNYCEPQDLWFYRDLGASKQFLINQVIESNKHRFDQDNAKTLLNWLRESNATYSGNNFLFRSLPVLLIEDTTNQSSSIEDGFDGVIKDFPNDHFRLRLEIKNAIRSWRSALANDLDLIGLDPRTQKIYPKHRTSFISYYKLKILSRHFVDHKSKRLNYIWTTTEIKSLNDSNEAFHKKMEQTIQKPPKYLEKQFHDFFRANPTFIKGEDFITTQEEILYEKHLYKNGTRKYDEPDFINKPYEYALRFPEIFEIKRQSQRILRYGKEKFISKARKSFEQVKRYKAYMTSVNPQNQHYIKKYLGKLYSSYEYTLLMGSREEKQEHEDLIERLKSDFDFEDINLLTYEDLLDRHIRLCNRLDEFDVLT
jgi:hypothetical protein